MRRAVVLVAAIAVLAAGGGWYAWNEVVPGTPVELAILPSADIVLEPTAHERLTVRASDARGRVVGAKVGWSGDIAVRDDGAITAPDRAGTYYVDASVGGLLSTAKITVRPGAAKTLRVLPVTTTVKPRDNITFSATAFDDWGNGVPITPAWRVANGGGSIDAQGTFVAGVSGDATIVADVGGLVASANVTTKCAPPRTETGAGLTFNVVCGTYADVWLNGGGYDTQATTNLVDDAVADVERLSGRAFTHRLTVSVFGTKAGFDVGLKQLYHVDASPFEEGVFIPPGFVAIDWTAPDPPEAVVRHEITHLVVAQTVGRQPVPYWLNEGLATVNEFGVADDTAAISRYCTASAAKITKLPVLADISSRDGWTRYVGAVGPSAYNIAAEITSLLVGDAKGEISLLDKLGGGLPIDSSYLAASGRSFEAFTTELPDRARALADRYPGVVAITSSRDGGSLWISYGQPAGSRVSVDIRNSVYFGNGSATTDAFGCAVGYLSDAWPHGSFAVTLTGPAGAATTTLRR